LEKAYLRFCEGDTIAASLSSSNQRSQTATRIPRIIRKSYLFRAKKEKPTNALTNGDDESRSTSRARKGEQTNKTASSKGSKGSLQGEGLEAGKIVVR